MCGKYLNLMSDIEIRLEIFYLWLIVSTFVKFKCAYLMLFLFYFSHKIIHISYT